MTSASLCGRDGGCRHGCLRRPQDDQEAREAHGRGRRRRAAPRTGSRCSTRRTKPKPSPCREDPVRRVLDPRIPWHRQRQPQAISPRPLKELEAALNSPCMTEADKPARTKLIAQVAYQVKDYPKAIEFGKRVVRDRAPTRTSASTWAMRITSRTISRTPSRCIKDVIVKLEGRGKTPTNRRCASFRAPATSIKDNDCVAEQIEKLVVHYPKPQYWQDLINSLLRVSKNDKRTAQHPAARRWRRRA